MQVLVCILYPSRANSSVRGTIQIRKHCVFGGRLKPHPTQHHGRDPISPLVMVAFNFKKRTGNLVMDLLPSCLVWF